jgi:hypothetical protein
MAARATEAPRSAASSKTNWPASKIPNYDLSADSDCVKTLAQTRIADLEKLRTQMRAELKAAGDLRAIGRGAEYEADVSADNKKSGFYETYTGG